MARTRLLSLVLASAVLAAAVVGCGGGGGKKSFSLTIGNIIPLTGDLSPFGPSGRKAGDLAVKEINDAVKKDGLKQTVTIKPADEQTDPQASVAAARTLVTANHAQCIVGAYASADTIPVSKSVSIPNGVLQISPASTSVEITPIKDNGLLNRTAPPDSRQGPALAAVVADALGGASGKTVNVGARNDAYGTALAGTFSSAWTGKGGKIGQKVIYDPKLPSYDSEAGKLVSGSPDAWVIIDFPETYQKVGPALVRTGKWDPKKTFATDGLASSGLPKMVGGAATNGMRGTAPGSPKTGAAATAFDKLYTSAGGPGRNTFDAQVFDATILCYLSAVSAGQANGRAMAGKLRALTTPGGTDYDFTQLPQAIKDVQAGKKIHYLGASGPIDLDTAGDPTAGYYDVYQYAAGKLKITKQVPIPGTQAASG